MEPGRWTDDAEVGIDWPGAAVGRASYRVIDVEVGQIRRRLTYPSPSSSLSVVLGAPRAGPKATSLSTDRAGRPARAGDWSRRRAGGFLFSFLNRTTLVPRLWRSWCWRRRDVMRYGVDRADGAVLRTATRAHRHPLYPLFWGRRAPGRKQRASAPTGQVDRLGPAIGRGAGPADFFLAF